MAQYAFNPITGTLDRVSDGGGGGGSITIVTDNGTITGSAIGVRGGNAYDDIPIITTEVSGPNVFVYNNAWATPYVVDALTTSGERGTFSTIQSAIYQATQDGAGTDNQKIILIRNGSYAENLVIPSGIFLKGDDQIIGRPELPSYCVIAGNHTIIGPCVFRAENIKFLNVSPDDDMFDDGADQIWFCDNCDFDNGGSTGVICTVNFPAGTFKNCYFRGNPGSVNIDLVGADVDFINCKFIDSGIISATEGTIAKFHHSQVRPIVACNASQVVAEDTLFIGGENAVTGTGGACSYNRCVFNTTGFGVTHASRQTFTACSMSDGTFSGLYPFDSDYDTTSSQMGNIASSVRVEGNITVNTNQYLLEVDTSAGPITITLPAEFPADRCWIVKDVSGTAETNPITIQVSGVGLIDGLPLAIINTNYGAKCFKGSTDGENYLVVWDAYNGSGGGGGSVTISADSGAPITGDNFLLSGRDYKNNVPVVSTQNDSGTTYTENRAWATPYVVDALTTPGERGTFSTIQSAIDQAVANGDADFVEGKTASILIRNAPTLSYEENLVFPAGNFHVVANKQPVRRGTQPLFIVGKQTISENSRVVFENVGLLNGVEPAFDNSGVLTVINSWCEPAGDNIADGAVFQAYNSTIRALEFNNGTVELYDCDLDWPGPGQMSNVQFVIKNCSGTNAANHISLDDGSHGYIINCTSMSIAGDTSGTILIDGGSFSDTIDTPNASIIYNTVSQTPNSGFTEFFTTDPENLLKKASESGNTWKRTEASDSSQTVGAREQYVAMTSTGPSQVYIDPTSCVKQQFWIFVDETGTASFNPRTIVPTNSATINGAANLVIDTDYGWAIVTWTGTEFLALTGTAGSGGGIQILSTEATTAEFETVGTSSVLSFLGQNLLIGSDGAITLGLANTGLGVDSLENISVGDGNTAFGQQALNANQGGSRNTAVGLNSLQEFNPGTSPDLTNNTAVGANSLQNLSEGVANTALGYSAGSNYTTDESSNILVGSPGVAGESNTTRIGSQGTGEGQQNRAFIAGIAGSTVADSRIVGISSTGQLSEFGTGTSGQILVSGGAGVSPTWQDQSGGGGGIATLLTSATTAEFSTAGSTSTLDFNGDNLLVGSDGSLTDGIYNTGYGVSALENTTTGVENSALGVSALESNLGGSRNTAVGSSALSAFNSGSTEIYTYNSAVGSNSLISLVDGVWNTALGSLSGIAYTGSESSNILVQNQGVAGESNTIRIGTSGSGIGNQNRAFIAGVSGVTVSDSRIVGISSTGQLSEFGDGEEGQVLVSGGSGVSPTWQDQEASGLQTLTGNDGLPVSPDAGNIDVIAANSSVIFRRPGAGVLEIDFGEQNFCLGSALIDLTTGVQNTGLGSASLTSLTSGSSNTCLGIASGSNIISGNNNTFVGTSAGNLTNVSNNNTCIGVESLYNASGMDCSNNTALGYRALYNTPSGSANTAIGNSAGSAYNTNETNNLVIASDGVAGDNNTIRIGGVAHNRFFGAGISGVSVSNSSIVGVNASGQLSDLGKGAAGQVLISTGISGSPSWGPQTKGFFGWLEVSSPTAAVSMNANVGYINKSTAATVAFTLPPAASVGDRIMVTNMTSAVIRINQNASQNISFLNQTTTIGISGHVQSFDTPAKGFCIELLCVTANTQWLITNLTGNATLA